MKKLLSFIVMILMGMSLMAKPVDPTVAVRVAQNFVAMQVKMADNTAKIVYTHPMPESGQPAMYVVNVGSSAFVIVAADDIAHPVLGYSMARPWPVLTGERRSENGEPNATEGSERASLENGEPNATEGSERASLENGEQVAAIQLPSQVSGFLDDLASQIQAAQQQDITQDRETAAEWRQLQTGDLSASSSPLSAPDSVGPLLTTTWDQGQYYNALCPEDANGPDGHALTGCVATAMAQIINYWGYPVHGRGSHSYQHNTYGTLSVNYDIANYDYANMPSALTATSTPQEVQAVAKLMHDCGVAANMGYGPTESGAYFHDAFAGLINYFQFFIDDARCIYRSVYENDEWESLIAHSIEMQEPVYYGGFGPVGGHAWVVDGYNENGFFHFNFGWGGGADGWYSLSTGNYYGFTIDNLALVNLHPDSSANVVVGYDGKDEYVVMDFIDFNNIFGPAPYIQNLGLRYDTITFVPDDSTSQLVLDVVDFWNGNIMVYDGINTDSLLRIFFVDRMGCNIQPVDRTPIVSTQNAITIVYNRSAHEGLHLRISKETDCRMVSNIEVQTSPTSINVSWIENGGSSLYEVEYGFKGFLRGDGEIDTVSTNNITLTNIEQDSIYELYIRPICGSSGVITSIVVNNRTYWTDIVDSEPAGYNVDTNGIIHISSPEGLAWISKLTWEMGESNLYYRRNSISIESDLDLDGHLWKPINGWSGNFDGNTRVIYNMTVDGEGQGGLFRAFDGDTIKDIGFIDATIKASQIGVISDWSGYNCHAINCFSQEHRLDGVGRQTGGLFGEFYGIMVNCFASGSLVSAYYQGGIVGVGSPNLYNCYSSVTSLLAPPFSYSSGLICSSTTEGSFENCFADIDYQKNTWSAYNDGATFDEENTEEYFLGYSSYINKIRNISAFTRKANTLAHTVPDTSLNYQYNGSVDLVTALNQGVAEYNSPLLRTWIWDSVSALPMFGDYFQVLCPNVSNISASNIIHNGNYAVALSWVENGTAEEWQIKCVPIGQPEDSSLYYQSYSQSDTIQGLRLGVTYCFYVKPVCDSVNSGAWGQPITFLVDMPYWDEVVTSPPEGYVEDANGNVKIYSAEGLTWLAICSNGLYGQNRNDYEGKQIRIMSNIDLAGFKWRPISRTNNYKNSFSDGYQIERSFKGIIYGNRHTISNLYCNEDFGDEEYNTYCVGLISYATNAIISDLYFSDCYVKGRVTVGTMIGIARDCLISNCHSDGYVFGMQLVGGLVGCLKTSNEGNECKVINSSSTGYIYGDYGVGGFIGKMEDFTRTINSYSLTDIFGYGNPDIGTPGNFAGLNVGIILNCYHVGNVDTLSNVNGGSRYTSGSNTSPILDMGVLQSPITIGTTTYYDLLSALNAWVDAYDTAGIYRHWAADSTGENSGFPVFANIPCITTTGSDSITVCDSYTWHGNAYTTDTVLVDTIFNMMGCDSIVTHYLTVNHSSSGVDVQTACDSYTWIDSNTYTESDFNSQFLILNSLGCDSTVTLHLTINHSTSDDTTAVACDSFTWWNTNYANSTNEATHTLTNAAGCDSTVTLHLTINNPVHTATTEAACETYTWNETAYTVGGDYTYSHLDNNGCTQVDTLHLTINNPVHTATSETACETYTWNGTDYTVSGDYTYSHTDANGCTQVDTLHLTINNPVHTATTEAACETYTWNETAYTVSGDYTYSHLDNNGCTQVDTLHLTINNPVHTATTEAACETYTWNGTAYTVSGDYTYVHADNSGCTQVDTLHLTINNPVHTATTEAACETYTWNGTAYTVSGDYSYVHTDNNGCTQVDTLHLTVNHSTTGDTAAVACDSFIWWNTNYTNSTNEATHTLTNAAGCDSTVTLHLTINHSTTGVDVQTACDSYTWIDGNTYTESNFSSQFSILNSLGCDSTVTLNLTINHSVTFYDTLTIGSNELPYDYYGNSIDGHGNFTFEGTTSEGCDSTTHLFVIVNQVGIGDVQTADGITIFPNPTSGMLTIRGNGLKRVEVMDVVGRTMLVVECQRDSERVDLSELQQGTYVVCIIAENGIAVRRVVKR